jgi:hypothetical protein
MQLDPDLLALFSHVTAEVEKRGLAYVNFTQPRTDLLMGEEKKWAVLHSAVEEGVVKVALEEIHLRHFTKLLKETPVFASKDVQGRNTSYSELF